MLLRSVSSPQFKSELLRGMGVAAGAGGPVMRDAIARVTAAFAGGAEGAFERSLQSSLLVSADMAHAHHPNYPEKHDPDHKPQFHRGLVIKHNVNQRYATNAISATLFRRVPPLLRILELPLGTGSPC